MDEHVCLFVCVSTCEYRFGLSFWEWRYACSSKCADPTPVCLGFCKPRTWLCGDSRPSCSPWPRVSFHYSALHHRRRLLPFHSLGLPLPAQLSFPPARSPLPHCTPISDLCFCMSSGGHRWQEQGIGNTWQWSSNSLQSFLYSSQQCPLWWVPRAECSFQCAIRHELRLCVVLITSTYCQVLLRILPLGMREPLVLATDFRNLLRVGVSAKLLVMCYCSWFVFWTLMCSAEVCKLQ